MPDDDYTSHWRAVAEAKHEAACEIALCVSVLTAVASGFWWRDTLLVVIPVFCATFAVITLPYRLALRKWKSPSA